MPNGTAPWTLEGFLELLDTWIQIESPPDDLRLLVTAWIMTRYDDPYQGVHREPSFENLWYGPVPRSANGKGAVVVCSYWIIESTRTVRCNSFATLNLPI